MPKFCETVQNLQKTQENNIISNYEWCMIKLIIVYFKVYDRVISKVINKVTERLLSDE